MSTHDTKSQSESAAAPHPLPAKRVVGIDLGTTNSLVATVKNGAPSVIVEGGRALIPSVVTFLPAGGVAVGDAARDLRTTHPDRTVQSIKRLIGKSAAEVASVLPHLPYTVEPGEGGGLAVRVGERRHSPQEISAVILTAIRERAERHFGEPVRDAVITVPAYFDDTQRQATRDAGKLAGLRVLRILNEPTAAALAYGLHEKKDGAIAVYDLGGGTFDISILMVSDGIFRVLATHGDTFLGGDDFDEALFHEAVKRSGLDAADPRLRSPAVLQALRKEAERVKLALSEAEEALFLIEAPELGEGSLGVPITRADFEALIAPLVARTFSSVKRVLADALIEPGEIDEIVLVGGSTRTPMVRQRVKAFFGREPHVELDPDEVVALGAAVQADILAGGNRDMLLLDVIPLSLGLETMGGAMTRVIERNTTVPAEATELFTTYADGQTAVDFRIFQGERELAADNRELGRFLLRGIPPMAAGMARIKVTYAVDESGILTVRALEERSGSHARVEVVPAHGLSEADVDRLLEEAYDHAEEDYRNRMRADMRIEAEQLLRATVKSLGSLPPGGVSAAERDAIAEAAERLRGVLDAVDFHEIKRGYDALNDATRPLAERMMDAAVQGALGDRRVDEI
jgi:molecular chaperone DnaK